MHICLHPQRASRVALLLVIAGLVTLGCREEKITVRDAKPEDAATGVVATPYATPETDVTDATVTTEADARAVVTGDAPWIVPDGWRESPDRPPMRHATLLFDDDSGTIEVAITRFPGDVGGMLANVNRWRGQVGLPPASADDLPDMLEPFSNPGFDGHLLNIRGERGNMLVASVHERGTDQTWFVRVIAAPEVADRIEPAVFDFARSFGRPR